MLEFLCCCFPGFLVLAMLGMIKFINCKCKSNKLNDPDDSLAQKARLIMLGEPPIQDTYIQKMFKECVKNES